MGFAHCQQAQHLMTASLMKDGACCKYLSFSAAGAAHVMPEDHDIMSALEAQLLA